MSDKSLQDLSEIISQLDAKIGKIQLPEFSMLSDKLAVIEEKKSELAAKLSEAKKTIDEKIIEESNSS